MKIIDVSDEVWMWVHWKYGISWIVWKYFLFETNTDLTLMCPMIIDWIDKIMKHITCNAKAVKYSWQQK